MRDNTYEPLSEWKLKPPKDIGRRSRLLTTLLAVAALGLAVMLLMPARRTAVPFAVRMSCDNNLKMIGIGLRSYADHYHSFPPRYTVDSRGRPLHSWRTLILPFIEEDQLYRSIDLSKAWNDPVNSQARRSAPSVFHCPAANDNAPHYTTYLAVVAPAGAFHPDRARRPAEFEDAQTLMVIEVPAKDAFHWMSPHDTDAGFVLRFDSQTEFAHQGGTHVVFSDGTVRFLSGGVPQSIRRAMISIAGNEDLNWDD